MTVPFINVMLAPNINQSFAATSGNTYLSSPYGLIYPVLQSDTASLQALGCTLLSPRNAISIQRAPLGTDDFTADFNVGSQWAFVNGTTTNIYICYSMGGAPGSALWSVATGAQGPQGPTGPKGNPAINWRGTYSSATIYAQGDGITYSGTAYISLINANLNNTPSSSPSDWQSVTSVASAPNFIDVYLIGGQSNAQGFGTSGTITVTTGKCLQYKASGATIVDCNDPVGDGPNAAQTGSMWPAFAQMYYNLTGRSICVVPSAVGGTDQSYQAEITDQSQFTGSISGTTLTVSGVTGTGIAIGDGVNTVSGSGVTPGTLITGGSGTTWTVNNSQSVSSQAMVSWNAANNWDNPANGGTLYGTSVTNLNAALTALTAAGYSPIFRGVLWCQGENDASALSGTSGYTISIYTTALQAMIARYRAATIGGSTYPTMPFWIWQTGGLSIGAINVNPGGDTWYYNEIRAGQQAVADADQYTYIASPYAIKLVELGLVSPTAGSSSLHWTQPGYNFQGSYGATQVVAQSQVMPDLFNRAGVSMNYVTPNRNLLYNGDMFFDQVNGGGVINCTTSGVTQLVDGVFLYTQTAASGITAQRWTTLSQGLEAAGFPYCLKVEVATGAGSVGASDFIVLEFPVEARDLRETFFGTPRAQNVSLSFWLQIFPAGTFGISLRGYNSGTGRSFITPQTFSSSSALERVSIVIPGDCLGAWDITSEQTALWVQICLDCGSTYQTTTTGIWINGVHLSNSAQTHWSTTSTSAFIITGAKLEVAPSPTPYVFEPTIMGFERCQRNYEQSYNYGQSAGATTAVGASIIVGASMGPTAGITVPYKVPKRFGSTGSSVITLYPRSVNAGKVWDQVNSAEVNAFVFGQSENNFTWTSAPSSGVSVDLQAQWTSDCRMGPNP